MAGSGNANDSVGDVPVMTLIEGVMGQVADLSASVQVASAGTAETAHSSNHYSLLSTFLPYRMSRSLAAQHDSREFNAG